VATDYGVIDRAANPDAMEGDSYDDAEDQAQAEAKPHALETLQKYLQAENIATLLDEDELNRIGERVVREYKIDKASQKEWEDNNSEAMKLALQVAEEKNYPWPKAANVKFPLLTTAAIQFAARAYPAIVSGPDVVKGKVVGEDPDGMKRKRADRVGRHMSWQLTEEMAEWEEDTDKLLHILPISGMVYRKSYFSPELGRNKSELVMPDCLVVNKAARSFETLPRATHEIELYPTEIEERFRAGLYKKCELGLSEGDDEDAPHKFLEQHRRLDLDGDGYKEPYIVTVHREKSKVVRIIANFFQEGIALNEQGDIAKIEPEQYFTKYSFLPNPSGEWHDIGFGYLLRPINESVNTVLNQLLDAGHLANAGGGFIGSGARLKGGAYRFRPGEWKPVDVPGNALRENMVPLVFPGPNATLFQLLGLLIEAGKDVSSVKDIMTGTEPKSGNTPATTTLALIEQGMQVFSAIYKRIYRALKSEYGKLFKLNARYLDKNTYFTVLDTPEAIGPEDYDSEDFDVVPVADPNVVTNMQKLARAEFLNQFRDDPLFNGLEIRQRMLDAAGIDDTAKLIVGQAPPDAKVALEADKIDIEKRKLQLAEIELEGQLALWETQGLKNIADAEAAEAGTQIAAYQGLMKGLTERAKVSVMSSKAEEKANVDQGAV
jgi:chaperonin GroES